MTSALWLFYLGGVVSSLTASCTIAAVMLTIAMGIIWVVYAVEEGRTIKPPSWMAKTIIACIIFACILPSKTVLYTAAAVNVGQTVVESETGRLAVSALNQWIREQLAPAPTNR